LVPANGYLTRGNGPSELWLVLVPVIALFEAGQLEVASHSRFYGSIAYEEIC